MGKPKLNDEDIQGGLEIGADVASTLVEGGDIGDVAGTLGEGLGGMAGEKLGAKLGKKLGNEEAGKQIGNVVGSAAGGVAKDLAADGLENLADVNLEELPVPELPAELPDIGGASCTSIFSCFKKSKK